VLCRRRDRRGDAVRVVQTVIYSETFGLRGPRTGRAFLQFVAFDAAYIARLKSGHDGTAKHFFSYFSELIRLKLRARLSSREASEDARQETLTRVLALVRSDGLKQPERLGALVNSVCNHVLLENYRSKHRREAPLEDEHLSMLVDPEPSAYNRMAQDDTQRTVKAILDALPERDRRLLQAVLLEERDKSEVCAEFGVTPDYLRVLIHRAKQTFKTQYIKHLNESSTGG
jgi:RNA polymerase sigma-70 factor (ECF subfamily)